jgi:hypothetical protein
MLRVGFETTTSALERGKTFHAWYLEEADVISEHFLLGFEVLRGGDYEECPLLGYKNQVRTSQETHKISPTASSQLMLCKI